MIGALLLVATLASRRRRSRARRAPASKLEEELRCLVCQNQTLADSDAPLAEDLRREVRALAVAGKSDDEIKDYLVARYGDFVLYKPPVKSHDVAALVRAASCCSSRAACIWLAIIRRRRGARPQRR